jgi:NADH:ubiquinone oxidoreductase subunit 6 (subunit J)
MFNIFHSSWFFGPVSMMGFGMFSILAGILGLLILFIVIGLKGFALWHAARRDEKWWFVALLIINTFGILEICYLLFVVGLWDKKNNYKTHNIDTEKPYSGPVDTENTK